MISDHKEIVRSIMSLQGAIFAVKQDIDELANVLLPFFFSNFEYMYRQLSNNSCLSYIEYYMKCVIIFKIHCTPKRDVCTYTHTHIQCNSNR